MGALIAGVAVGTALGAAAIVPLAYAPELALANRIPARSGGDPLSEKRRAEGIPTFAKAARRVLEQKRGGFTDDEGFSESVSSCRS